MKTDLVDPRKRITGARETTDRGENQVHKFQIRRPKLAGLVAMVLASVCIVGLSQTLIGCSLKKPAQEVPVPNEQVFAKSFFIGDDKDTPTFLFGLTPEKEMGSDAPYFYTHSYPLSAHINVQFEINEKSLVAKVVNPSFPDDRSKWKSLFVIPIKRHFYIESGRDEFGRTTNRTVENSERSHWSARSHVELDLSSLSFLEVEYGFQTGLRFEMQDLDIDSENKFIGFSISGVNTWAMAMWNSEAQATFRVNLLAFKHNPQFKKTPFAQSNYRHFNVLHYTGKLIDGQVPVLYAGHWDLSRDREIHLIGVPKNREDLVKSVVESWNATLKKVGALAQDRKGFIPVISELTQNRKHFFDLRYPTIYWVEDKRISQTAPLGIGYAHMDSLNGEILWGGISIFAGEVERLIQSASPLASAGPSTSTNEDLFSRIAPKSQSQWQSPFAQLFSQAFSGGTLGASGGVAIGSALGQKMTQINSKVQNQLSSLDQFLPFSAQAASEKPGSEKVSAQRKTQKGNGFPQSSSRFCGDRRFSDVASSLAGLGSRSDRSLADITESYLKDLLMHEYGHFLGLGHNFKENILPQKGSVPEKYYVTLAADHQKSMTNVSSVMGYKNTKTDLATPSDKIKPGPHDELLLRYLYRQEYSVFKPGAEDFEFRPVKEDGLIPETPQADGTRVAYFPQCNDLTASYGSDPYCHRWDRGSSALELVQNHVEDLTEDLVRTMNSFSEVSGANPWHRESALWQKSFFFLSRVRLFYDHMRVRFEKVIDSFRQNEEALFEFAQCRTTREFKSPLLQKAFAENPELYDLCQANSFALQSYKSLLDKNLNDITVINSERAIMPGGMTAGEAAPDYSKLYGTWSELGALPLKYAALYSLLSPTPYLGGMHLSTAQHGYSYSSLFPFQYTETIASAITSNLRFANNGTQATTQMGQAVYYLSRLLGDHRFHNDTARFPKQFMSRIENQTVFDFSLAAIVVTAVRNQDNNRLVELFTGKVLDFNTNKEIPAQRVFVLPGGEVLATAEGMFLYPVTKLRMYSNDEGYVLAYRSSFNREMSDKLADTGTHARLKSEHDRLLEPCVSAANGLEQYFTKGTEFKGFELPPGATQEEVFQQFLKSVNANYQQYYTSERFKASPPKPETCAETLRGLGLVMSTSALLNGFWLPETIDYLQKGGN